MKPTLTWFFDRVFNCTAVRRHDGAVLRIPPTPRCGRAAVDENLLFEFASGIANPFQLSYSDKRGYYFSKLFKGGASA